MSDVTRLLDAAQRGDTTAAAELLPLVYDELHRLAAAKMAGEAPGHTLDATALVHEAYLRLTGGQSFESRSHFLRAAGEAMRRILVDHARARHAVKRGGDAPRAAIEPDALPDRYSDADLIDIDSVLDVLARDDPDAADLVRLHVFGGMSVEEAGTALGKARATAFRSWRFARAWLRDALGRPA
jgi:RNA polymerase sigma factor (TIGR02999 family)